MSSRAGGVLYLDSSALVKLAVREPETAALEAELMLTTAVEMAMTDRVRQAASRLAPPELRTLDAIHIASALVLGDDLAAVVTYDVRMQRAAERRHLVVLAPS